MWLWLYFTKNTASGKCFGTTMENFSNYNSLKYKKLISDIIFSTRLNCFGFCSKIIKSSTKICNPAAF